MSQFAPPKPKALQLGTDRSGTSRSRAKRKKHTTHWSSPVVNNTAQSTLQRALEVSKPENEDEQEADAVASEVMRKEETASYGSENGDKSANNGEHASIKKPVSGVWPSLSQSVASVTVRRETTTQESDELQREPEEEEEKDDTENETLQRAVDGAAGGDDDEDKQAPLRGLGGGCASCGVQRKEEDENPGEEESVATTTDTAQAKLVVGRTDDPQEREADAVAERVMRMEDSEVSEPSQSDDTLRRAPTSEEDEETTSAPLRGLGGGCTSCGVQRKEDDAVIDNELTDASTETAQAALVLGRTDDPQEREADAVAERVMRMRDADAFGKGGNKLQRSPEEDELRDAPLRGLGGSGCSSCGAQRKPEAEDEKQERTSSSRRFKPIVLNPRDALSPTTQRRFKPIVLGGHKVPSTVSDSINELRRNGGTPLPRSVRQDFEHRFGQDFSAVRIHTGEGPATVAQQLRAKAFTLGKDVVFGRGHFQPHTDSGKRLLAHELTHVVQQSGHVQELAQTASTGDLQSDVTSRGEELSSKLKDALSRRFGVSFDEVRLHDDEHADALARRHGAAALTVGADVYFRDGVLDLDSRNGRQVLTHELLHYLQQRSAAPPRPDFGAPPNNAALEADVQNHSIAGQLTAPTQQAAHQGPQAYSWDEFKNDFGSTVNSAYDTASGAVGTVADAAGAVVDFGLNQLIAFIESQAPGFMAFLRKGPVEYIKEAVLKSLDSVLGGLVSNIADKGLIGALTELFGDSFSGIATVISELRANRCDALMAAINSIVDFFGAVAGPFMQDLRGLLGSAGEAISGIWTRFGQPAVEAIKSVAGGFWDTLVGLANDFWSVTAPIRGAFASVWEEFKRYFGIAWGAGEGAVAWVTKKASEAWESIKTALGPALVPLEILGGILSLATPLGPFVAMYASYQALSAAFSWVSSNWGDIRKFFIDSRDTLYNTVLPAIMSGVGAVGTALSGAASWVVGQLQNIASTVRDLAVSLGAAPLLNAFAGIISGIASTVSELAAWASSGFMGLVESVVGGLRQLHETIRPLYGLIGAIILFPANPFLLPVVLAGWAWRLTPDCIKGPIIDWVIELMRAAIKAMPAFSGFGEWWPKAREQIIGTLDTLAGTKDMAQKIAATNRIAKMMTLEDVEWIGNMVAAAIQAPSEFANAAITELTGMDLSMPLPFERTTTPETAGFGGGTSAVDLGVLSKPELSDDDVEVDSVGLIELEPELIESLTLREREMTPFGGAAPASASLDAIRREMAAAPTDEVASVSEEADTVPTVTFDGTSTGGLEAASNTVVPSYEGLTPEQRTEAELQALMAQEETGPDGEQCPSGEQAPAPQPAATNATIPEEMKIGPLTQAQRARYTMSQMTRGLAKWFDCNKAWLIPTVIVAIIALIAAEIFSGGAVTGALLPVMEVLGPLMIGVAAIRSSYFLAEYLAKSVGGDILGAAKSLASAVAVVAVEVVSEYTFRAIGPLFESLRKAATAVRRGVRSTAQAVGEATGSAARAVGSTVGSAGRRVGRMLASGAEALGGNVRRISGAMLQRGRLIMKGIGDGIGRGIRSLDDLARRLWNKVRFSGFYLQLTTRKIIVWAVINPRKKIAEIPLSAEQAEQLASGIGRRTRRTRPQGELPVEAPRVKAPAEAPLVRGTGDAPTVRLPDEAPATRPTAEAPTVGPRERRPRATSDAEAPRARANEGGRATELEAIDEEALIPGSAAHKKQRWEDYKNREGSWDYERWSKQYEANMRNPQVGLGREAVYREALGGESRILDTPFGHRQLDALVADRALAVQVKSGFENLTTTGRNANSLAIKKDAWLVKQGYDVEWVLEKGGSKPLLEALQTAGIRYHIGPILR